MRPDTRQQIISAVPTDLAMPESVPAELAAALDWPALAPLERLMIVRLFGRSTDRRQVARAWNVARGLGVTQNMVIDEFTGPLREWCGRKLGYANRHHEE